MAENPNFFPSIADNLLEFDRFVSQTSNPNPSFDSIQEPSSSFSDPISSLNFNPHPTSIDLLTVTIPRKRRRGRPRSTTSSVPSRLQVLSIPQFSRNSANANASAAHFPNAASVSSSNSSQIVNPSVNYSYNNNNNLSSSSSVKAPDISDEIIVINKEATAEALTALTSGFPADSLTDEEIDAGVVKVVGGIEQVNYILIRNHIITKWRENVSHWVTKEMFLNVVPEHCHPLLDNAYDYLLSQGYVNFGVAPSIKDKIPAEPCKPTVIIIGAGMAGLGAARQLMRFGFKVTVLEGRKRAGGRVYTKKMEGANRIAAADLGGSVLTGTLGNPLGILARQLSYSLHKIRDKCPIYSVDGSPVDPNLDSKVEIAFNKLLERSSTLRQLMGDVSMDLSLGAAMDTFRDVYGESVTDEEMRLFNWHLANLEYANAGLLSKLSLAFWDQDDPFDMGGDHCFLSGGNGRLIHALAENVPILYEKTVNTIRYGSDGVQVTAGNQVFEGDMVLCTVPLGVLKNGSIRFIPELPQKKLDGIKRLGFGLLNKVAMLFPHVFWGTDLDTFGHLCENSSSRGEFFLFYSYATVAGGPLLIALVAGEAAHKFENMPPTDAVAHVLQILRGIYEPQGISVPEPIQTVCTRWGSDPFCLGSYSNVAVGASGDDYDILAECVGDGRLFFAGEATTRRYPATMHGAFLTGLREAANMTRYASARALKLRVQRNPSKNAHTCASLLADLFREPDLEFGNFSIIFSKNNADPKSTAILRVTFSEPRRQNQEGSGVQHSNKLLFQQLQAHFNQQQQIHVYTLLTKEQALELREVRGGDDMRLNFLGEKLGVKLVGRKGLGTAGDVAIASIKAERGVNKPHLSSLALKSGILKRRVATGKQRIIRRAKIVRSGGELVLPRAVGNGNPLPSHVSESASSSSLIPSQVLKNEKPSLYHFEAPALLPSSDVHIEKTPAPDQRDNSRLTSPYPPPVASCSPNELLQQKPDS